MIAATLRRIAADPLGGATKRRDDLRPGTRSFHMRHAHGVVARVASPVHVVFYRVEASDIVEIVRVLHERMDPARHVGGDR